MNFWDFDFWSFMLTMCTLLAFIVLANILRRTIPFLRKSFLPSALIGGVLALICKSVGLLDFVDTDVLDMITYHAIAIGFIAMSLKRSYKPAEAKGVAVNRAVDSGALIVGTYIVQAFVGLLISMLLAATLFPELFETAGILLPLGFGQGTGQANNFGSLFEGLGFTGGQSFALSIASVGFLIGGLVGVVYLNILKAKGKVVIDTTATEATGEIIEGNPDEEMPVTEPVDKLTMNLGVMALIMLVTYGFMWAIYQWVVPLFGTFGTDTLLPLVYGFNFVFGALFALLYKVIYKKLRKANIAKYEYTDNNTLNRISGFSFDLMIIAGVTLIDVSVMGDLIIPLIIICAIGAVITFMYVHFVCKVIYKDEQLANFLGFFGMLCGTASTGVTLIRLVDPTLKGNASVNLMTGSTFAIIIGFPLLTIVTLAPSYPWLVVGLIILFGAAVNIILFRRSIFKRRNKSVATTEVATEDNA